MGKKNGSIVSKGSVSRSVLWVFGLQDLGLFSLLSEIISLQQNPPLSLSLTHTHTHTLLH